MNTEAISNQLTGFPGLSPGENVEIWYRKSEIGYGTNFDPKNPEATHILLGTIGNVINPDGSKTILLEHIYFAMQGEIWSPNGEANALIRSKGLHHTSMSVGDVVRLSIVKPNAPWYMVKNMGFEQMV